ncbi:hypothetical protein P1J78_07190 [Psychromarinibacter sp. C21-152]|uniref:DUF1795 domain-containing protein n=1 Tax=Psychromarinibacter sediminicola TaxID=3033385 RepID=A0AAE3NTA7_9RHOB|nr:hypothetical protein [Psychromarinibacter sediminicola]MDF0600510.1 hypothetical protein [Psychromarinibacter sediminicola]
MSRTSRQRQSETGPRALVRGLLAGACLGAVLPGAAAAQTCRPVVVDAPEFCPAGTVWEGVALIPKLDGNRIRSLTGQYDRLWLVFAEIPYAEDLPRHPDQGDVAALLAGFGDLLVTYDDAEILETFAPLGTDVAAATMALHNPDTGYVTMYTYYAEGAARLVVQTSLQGAETLTDQHRDRHLQAVRALRETAE